jgi:tRNA (guanosine-2'-O-)-methyltransferase
MSENEVLEKSSLRIKADYASKKRCTTFICVLENPELLGNIAAIIRNIDCIGVAKVYIVGEEPELNKKNKNILNKCSSSAYKYVFVKYFKSSKECIEHLQKNNFTSLVTSPHIKGQTNLKLEETNFTKYKKLAVWFGNESNGVTDEVISKSSGCIQIKMCGIVESMNLAVSTGIVCHTIANQRRSYKENK